jgi:putative endonuclease
MFYVYVLKSLVKNRYYVGYTNDISSRLQRHNYGDVRSTRKFRPWMLLGFETYERRSEARWRERELKNHSTKRKEVIKSLEENIREIA